MVANPAVASVTGQQRLRGLRGFAFATLALTVVGALLLMLAFHGPGDTKAIWITAAFAAAVQITAFPAVKTLTARNLMIGWGTGSLIRLVSLGLYALVATLTGLSITAALISLALFYFLSMVIEPLFLRS